MEILKQAIKYLLVVIDAGASVRFLYCFMQIELNPDETNSYKKKMLHLGIFLILANCALSIMLLTKEYVLE